MNSPYLIPGNVQAPASYQPSPSRSGSPRFLKVFLSLWLIAGLVLAIWRIGLGHAKPADIVAAAPKMPSVAIGSEDLIHHVTDVSAKVDVSATRLHRAEDQISRTMSALDRNYLPLERQRLETALSSTESARRNLEQTRQELDLILSSLKEKNQ